MLDNDRVRPSDETERRKAPRSIYVPFTEGYFRAASGVLATKPAPQDVDLLSELLRRHYDIEGGITVLSSEVEYTAQVTASNGDRLILKTSSEPSAKDSFRFQAQTLAALQGTSGFAASDVRRTRGGMLVFEDDNVCGYLQTALSGVPLHHAEATPALLHQMGEALARLGLAMGSLELPEAFRPVLWHIGCWSRLPRLADHLPPDETANRVQAAMAFYIEHVEAQLAGVPWQVTHNDPSPFNTLLTENGVAFIDFGDGCWGPRIEDLAIAASHVVTDASHPLGGAEHLIAGYASVIPLSPLEVKLLPGLMKARQSALILINHWRAALFPMDAAYIKKNVARAEGGLALLSALTDAEAEAVVRNAASQRAPVRL